MACKHPKFGLILDSDATNASFVSSLLFCAKINRGALCLGTETDQGETDIGDLYKSRESAFSKRAGLVDCACGSCSRGCADLNRGCVDCDRMVHAFERVRWQA